jgi:hypothetical protein
MVPILNYIIFGPNSIQDCHRYKKIKLAKAALFEARICLNFNCKNIYSIFMHPSWDGPYYVIGYGGWADVHRGFRTITLVLYIGYLYQTWPHDSPVEGEEPYLFWGPLNRILTTGSFLHDNFSSVYWIFTKLGHMIPLWKGKNPIYFGVIRSKVKVTITINIVFDNRVVST